MSIIMTPAVSFLLLALVLIAIELGVLQLTVFWFLFFGIGALITSLVCWVFPTLPWTWAIGIFFLASLASTALLFPPLKRWQQQPSPLQGNDALGQTVKVIAAIGDQPGKVLWSGTEWPARKQHADSTDFAIGDTAVIKQVEGITLIVG